MSKTPSLDERLAAARRPERVVDVYLRGDLRAEWDALQAQIKAAGERTSLADPGPGGLAERAAQIEAEYAESRLPLRLRALNRDDALALSTAAAGDDGAYTATLLEKAIVDPELTAEQLTQLLDVLSAGDYSRLVAAAQELTFGDVSVPFSRKDSGGSRG